MSRRRTDEQNLIHGAPSGELSRRRLLRVAAMAGTLFGVPAILTACGGGDEEEEEEEEEAEEEED